MERVFFFMIANGRASGGQAAYGGGVNTVATLFTPPLAEEN